jgi:Flp pilus assembly protein TadD
MTPRVLKKILVVAFNAWWCCALSLSAPPLVLAQSSPPLPNDLRIESPAPDLPPAIKEFSGAWEGKWRVITTAPFGRGEMARVKVILVVEKVWDQGANVVFAWGDCPGFRSSKKWGRYQARISPHDGRMGLTFTAADGRDYTFSINNRGHLEAIVNWGWGRLIDIEMTRREIAPTGGKGLAAKPAESKAAAEKEEAAHKQQALALARKAKYDQALAEINQALTQDPKDAETYNRRGGIYTLQGHYAQAVADFTKALELNPRYAKAYYNRALAYYYQGNYDQAINDLTKAIELKPKDVASYNNRGLAYMQKGNYERAIDDFNVATILNPKLADAYYNKAVSCEKVGRRDTAREAYAAFVKLAPPAAKDQIEQAQRKLR